MYLGDNRVIILQKSLVISIAVDLPQPNVEATDR